MPCVFGGCDSFEAPRCAARAAYYTGFFLEMMVLVFEGEVDAILAGGFDLQGGVDGVVWGALAGNGGVWREGGAREPCSQVARKNWVRSAPGVDGKVGKGKWGLE